MTRINCVGDICPVPVIKTKKALSQANTGLEVLVDNEIAVQNISKLLNSIGCAFSAAKDGEHFLISISSTSSSIPESFAKFDKNGSLVVISSQVMGTGDDNLGKLLIKGFIFATTQMEALPTAVVFYNSGVHLVLQNSESLKDLQYLHDQGVKILACGTCLNHFKVIDELAVGEVTDMYNIVNLMQQAANIIRP